MTKPDTPAEVALARANQALWEIQRQKRAREAELRQAVDELKRQHAEQVHGEFITRLTEAASAAHEARVVVDAERVASAPSRSPYPIGTILHRWEDGAASWARNHSWQRTNTTGRVEVFTAKSAWPANQTSGKPEPGDVVIRPLNKQGKPLAKRVRLTGGMHSYGGEDWEAREWCAEGETPTNHCRLHREVEA